MLDITHTLLHPATNIWVSSSVHFLRGFFSGLTGEAVPVGFLSPPPASSPAPNATFALPLALEASEGDNLTFFNLPDALAYAELDSPVAVTATASSPVSSLKFHPSTTRGACGRASETRLCFKADEGPATTDDVEVDAEAAT